MAKAEQEAGTGPHGTIAEAIRHRYGELTTTERKPAQTLLGAYPFAGLETVARFAERAGVSGPTILRLVAKLGYSGYAEFQQELRDELQAQLQSPLTKRPDGEASGRRPNFLESFGEAVTGNIQQTLESVHQSEFDAVVELLADEKRPLYLLDGGRRHVRVGFDIRRYQHDVIRFAEEAARRGATVVLFTDQWLSPVSGVARHMLTARVTVPSSWDSMIGMFLIVEALIARISEKMWPTVKSRVEELDRMLNPPGRDGE